MISRTRTMTLAAAVVTVALAAAAIASRSAAFHTLSWMAPDSASYVNWDIGRTPAYPLLLRLIPMDRLALVQLLSLCAAAAWLTWELAALLPAPLAVGFELAVLGNVQLVAYAFTVLPEAFFVTVAQIQLALALRLIRSASRLEGVLLGIATALLILLKPSGYSFVAPLIALVWLRWRSARTAVVPAMATMVGVLVIVSAVNLARAGVFATQAYGAYALIGYVGHLVDADAPAEYPELPRTIAARTAESRADLQATTGLDAYYMVSSNAYHDVLDAIRAAILGVVHRENPAISDREAAVRLNTIAQSLAVSAIARHPSGYLRQVAAHVYGLWSLPLLRNRADAERFAAELDRMKRAAPFTMRNPIVFRTVPPLLFWPIKATLLITFLAACAGVVLGIRGGGSNLTTSLAYCAIAVQANFLLVAAVQTGLPRYALAMWPAAMAAAALGVWAGIERIRVTPAAPGRGTTRRAEPSA
jgi:hypothetical protein